MAGKNARCLHTIPRPVEVLSMPAHPLSPREREEVRWGIGRSESVTSIAVRLGRHRTTISREISRNGGRGAYRACAAQDRAKACRSRPKSRLFQQFPELASHVRARLEAKDSPMTIAVELAQGVYPMDGRTVSHETIYRAIYDPFHRDLPRDVYRCLHRRRRSRHPRGYRSPHRGTWRDVLPLIHERPAAATDRSEVGHLEGDLIIGSNRRAAIITVFDRKSRYLWMAPLPDGVSADKTLRVLTRLITRIPPPLRRSLTWDQGGELARYATLAKRCGINVYFAEPHSPWQRPTNENGNGLIRRYVGKGTDLTTFTATDLRTIEDRINTMPRRIHNWATAQQIYNEAVAMTG
jgi:transposase, IS30 family